jgi:hypothetical protein
LLTPSVDANDKAPMQAGLPPGRGTPGRRDAGAPSRQAALNIRARARVVAARYLLS